MTPQSPTFTSREMMAIAAAREIQDGDIVFCGTGISLLAAMAAKNIGAPDAVIFFESGAIDTRLAQLPLAVSDSRIMFGSAVNGSLIDSFAYMQNPKTGPRVVGVIGAAQIDPFGNLNSTHIGDYDKVRVRFPGSGGASDVAAFVGRTIVFMRHERRRFVERVDYLTSAGWLSGPGARSQAGLPEYGPHAVITDLAVMAFDPDTRRMVLRDCYPGVTPETVQAHTGFLIDTRRARTIDAPTAEELHILRERCDPDRLILGTPLPQ